VKDSLAKVIAFYIRRKEKHQKPGTLKEQTSSFSTAIPLSWTHAFNFFKDSLVIMSKLDKFRSRIVLVISLSQVLNHSERKQKVMNCDIIHPWLNERAVWGAAKLYMSFC